jgi:outer membrane receptor protein involved in Fe transport
VAGGLALSLAARTADAAPALPKLSIAPTTYAEALIELGVQANVSIVGVSACGTGGRAGVSGQVPLEAALKALTDGAPCTYRILDARTVRIVPAVGPASALATHPATLVAELMVTATKRPAYLNSLPASVSVVSREQIQTTGALNITDLADQVSGILATNLGPGRDKLILRGLSDGAFTGRTRATVGSYLDETPINYNAPDPDLPLVDVDRVEVIRGPQGALYGSGSISGIYRVVTRKADPTQAEFGGQASYARTEGGSPSDQVDGYANLPLIADHLAVRLVGYYDVRGGFIDNAELQASNIDRVGRDGGRLGVHFQPNPDWQFDLEAAVQRLRSNDTQYTTPSTLGPTERMSRVHEGHKNDFHEATLTARGELGFATLRSTLAYVDHAFSSQYDATAALEGLQAPAAADLGIYLEKTRLHMLVTDTVLRSSGAGRLSWLVGVYGLTTIEKSPSTIAVQSPTGLSDAYQEHRRDRVREAAVYGEANYQFAPGWTLSAGGRLFSTEVTTLAAVQVTLPTPVARQFDERRNFPGFSPKLSIQYAFNDDAIVYGLFSEGFRPGGFNSGGFFAFFLAGRDHFEADRLSNYEVGVKARMLDRRLSLRSAVFFDRWHNIQTDQYRQSGLPFTANVGDANIQGLETEASYDVGGGLTLQASLLAVHSHMTRVNVPVFSAAVTSQLPGSPTLTAGLLAIYERPLRHGLTARLVAEAGYVGRSPVSFDATRTATEGGYARTELSAQLATRRWTGTLFVSNPTDAAGDTFAYGNPFTFGLVRQTTPQRPRTIGVRLTADY